VLETPQIKHSHATIGTATDKNIDTASTEAHVKDLLVVGDELSLCGEGRNVPYGTGGINAGSDDELGRESIPVERCQGRSVLGRLGVGQ